MEINYSNIREIERDINAALATVGAKYGLVICLNGGRFDTFDGTLRIKLTQATAAGKREAAKSAAQQFAQYASMVGADPKWLGKTLHLQGTQFRVAGIAPGRSKNCIKITRVFDGKGFVCPASSVRNNLD